LGGYEDLLDADDYLGKTNPKPQNNEDVFFMRAVGKLSPEGKKKIYDYIEMVDTILGRCVRHRNAHAKIQDTFPDW
jgi:hypothetical protein